MLRAAACQRKSGRRFDFFSVFRLARASAPSLLAGAGGNLPGKSVRTNPVLLVFPRSPRLIRALVRTRRTLSNEQTLRYIMGATTSRCEEAEEPEVRALDSLTTGSPPPFFARSCWVGSQEEALDGLRPPLLTFASLLSIAGRGRGRGRGRGARRRGVCALRRYQGTHTSVAVCLSPRMIDRRPPLPVGFKIPARLLTARHPPLQIETAPFDPRFPQQNQAKHCYTRYNEFHK